MAQKEFSRKIYRVSDSDLVIIMGKLEGTRLTYEEYNAEAKGVVLQTVTLINATDVDGTGMVIVAGHLPGDGTLEVLQMVDFKEDLAFKIGNGEKSIGFFSSKKLRKTEKKVSSSGKEYHKLKFAGGENKSIILNAFGFNKLPEGEIYPMVIQPAPDGALFDVRKSSFEKDGETINWTTFYAFSPMQFR